MSEYVSFSTDKYFAIGNCTMQYLPISTTVLWLFVLSPQPIWQCMFGPVESHDPSSGPWMAQSSPISLLARHLDNARTFDMPLLSPPLCPTPRSLPTNQLVHTRKEQDGNIILGSHVTSPVLLCWKTSPGLFHFLFNTLVASTPPIT